MVNYKKNYQNLKLKNSSYFQIDYGTIDRGNPEVIYINYKTYLSSRNENEDNKLIINKSLKKLKKLVKPLIKSSRFDKEFIFDYDILQDIQPIFKNKILTFELLLKQPTDEILKVKKLEPYVKQISQNLIDNISEFLQINNIELSKAKKN